MKQLKVGDTVRLKFGPYRTTGEVVRIIDAGAVIQPAGVATLVGYDQTMVAPNGDALTEDRGETFIGKAHWESVEVLG
jgi:hypothetical protein